MRNYKPSEFISAMLHSSGVIDNKGTKTCKRCKISKDVKDFSQKHTNADGRATICKECLGKDSISRYRKRKKENEMFKIF